MQALLKVVFSVLLFSGSIIDLVPLYSQGFEGEIIFSKETNEDTTYYAYKIKQEMVRAEVLDNKQQMVNYMIVDVSQRTIFAVNPNRKLYVEMPVHLWKPDKDTSNYKIIKSENYQMINGYKCYQWRVQNKKEDTEVTYWVCKDHYQMFSGFLKIMNIAEKSSTYFLNILDTQGFFPMMSVERSLLREMRMQISIITFRKKSLSPTLFEIPADYKLFQRN